MKELDLEGILFEVRWRGGFADRNNYFHISADIQIESLNNRVRTRIYNYFMEYYRTKPENSSSYKEEFINIFFQEFYLTGLVYDYYNNTGEIFHKAIEDTIFKDDWANVLTFIEFWAKIEK